MNPAISRLHRAMKSSDHSAGVRASVDLLTCAGMEPDTFIGADVRQMLRGVTDLIMRKVTDQSTFANVSRELRSLLSRSGNREAAVSFPVVPWPFEEHRPRRNDGHAFNRLASFVGRLPADNAHAR